MEIKGDTYIPASLQSVWDGLNNTDALQAAIPGCQSVTETSENHFDVVAKVAVGPVKATFRAKINITDIKAPHSYVMNFNSHGGVAGVAKGNALIELSEEGEGTRLNYRTDVEMGGKLTQIGGRLIQSTADKMSAQFFDKFANFLKGETSTEQNKSPEANKSIKSTSDTVASDDNAGMQLSIKLSTLSVGIICFLIGLALGYLLAN